MRRLLVCSLLSTLTPAFAGVPATPTPAAKTEPATKAEPPRRALRAPEHVPELARQMLRRRMGRHALDVTDLFYAVLFLEHGDAQALAARVKSEPKLARPRAGDDDTVNVALPERFFVLQDELKSRAAAVELAAKARDDAKLAKAFGALTETCVACHSAYLEPAGPSPAP